MATPKNYGRDLNASKTTGDDPVEMAETTDELWVIYHQSQGETDGKTKERALARICCILENNLKEAKSLQDCFQIYIKAPIGSEVETKAEEKAFELAKTLDDFIKIYTEISVEGEVEKKTFRKIEELLRGQLKKETTVKGCLQVYAIALPESKVKEESLEMAIEFATTLEECNQIKRKAQGSEIKEKVLKKIGELTPSQ